MSSNEWALSDVFDVVAAAAPDRDMVVWGSTRRTYRQVAERTRGLAAFLAAHDVGMRRERDELARWECGQDRVAVVLHNCPEYLETMLGCFRARAVPFNVNHHYRPHELRDLLDMVGTDAVVYHRSLGPLLSEALGARTPVLVDVDDGSGVPALPNSTGFETAVTGHADGDALPTPSPDDLYLVCTGGTTGTPKAVLWRQADIFVSGMGGNDLTTAESLTEAAERGAGAWYATPPLMHAAAQWTAFGGIHAGATIVLHDDSQPFDARTILATATRERVTLMSIVGDAYARPLVEELQKGDYDLSSLFALATGGAATNEQYKQAFFELLPDVTIVEGYGASETGGMAFGARSRHTSPGGFAPAAGAAVLSADRSRFLKPGAEEVGWTARRGRVPLGYLDDPAKSEATFPVVDGERLSVPGDRARLLADGTIEMLGRDATVVNTGGEKVFVEEVEEALRRHPDIADVLVVGRPSERYGQEVVAVVQPHPGVTVDPGAVREFAARTMARFKAPRAVLICDQVQRHPTGKADYAWARTVAADAVDATTPSTTTTTQLAG